MYNKRSVAGQTSILCLKQNQKTSTFCCQSKTTIIYCWNCSDETVNRRVRVSSSNYWFCLQRMTALRVVVKYSSLVTIQVVALWYTRTHVHQHARVCAHLPRKPHTTMRCLWCGRVLLVRARALGLHCILILISAISYGYRYRI